MVTVGVSGSNVNFPKGTMVEEHLKAVTLVDCLGHPHSPTATMFSQTRPSCSVWILTWLH